MKVVHLSDVPHVENASPLFTAPVTAQTPFSEKESQQIVSWVHFPDGVRNKFHTHTCDQILIVTQGKGMVATEEKEIEITTGDVVHIPAGEKHRHGAKPGSAMTHIAILVAGQQVKLLED